MACRWYADIYRYLSVSPPLLVRTASRTRYRRCSVNTIPHRFRTFIPGSMDGRDSGSSWAWWGSGAA